MKNQSLWSFNHSAYGFSSGSLLDSSSSAQLNKEESSQYPLQPSISFFQAPFQSPELSSSIYSTYQMFPLGNPSPVEKFMTEFNAALYTSKVLPDIFDLGGLSAEAFSKSLYDYVYARSIDVVHGNPHYVASLAATPIKEEIDNYTLPIVLNIFVKSAAKFLFDKGTLNSSNASSLARKYAKIMEESTERNWAQEIPETKFLVLEEGFAEYMKSIDHFSVDTIEDLAVYFVNELKRFANKF
ncbi:unnamed protein product [Larinioides sclopetarius]|uniref:Uncharacterized protein n=1 Tax=Larinioides sclopetarius TaxID=280406 RepID=A0AAV1YZ24_9ARAC